MDSYMKDRYLSIVVPIYNEQEVINEFYTEVTSVMSQNDIPEYEIICINDGSSDGTRAILSHLAENDKQHLRVINFSRNFGQQMAITAGLARACGNAVVVIDVDLQDPPALIPDMLRLWLEGSDVVYAVRRARSGETRFKLLTAKYFYKFLEVMTDVSIPKDTGEFRLMDKKIVEIIKKMPERSRFTRGMVSWTGFKQTPIEYDRKERLAGVTKYPFRKMLKFAIDAIVSFSSKPLKLIELLGLIAVVISLIVLLYSLYGRIFTPDKLEPGWASIMTTVTFLGGVQLLSLGVIGEYIARIYDENKSRPLYIVDEEINFDRRET